VLSTFSTHSLKVHEAWIDGERSPAGRDPATMTVAKLADAGHKPRLWLAVIREKCLQSCARNRRDARLCAIANCAPRPYRLGTDPFPARRAQSPAPSVPNSGTNLPSRGTGSEPHPPSLNGHAAKAGRAASQPHQPWFIAYWFDPVDTPAPRQRAFLSAGEAAVFCRRKLAALGDQRCATHRPRHPPPPLRPPKRGRP
jgi:hypothetical protein